MPIHQINKNNIPQHLAIIMDGNGRWAKQRGKIRTFGHKNAIQAVRNAIEACDELKIPYLTLFAFSTENWNRPKKEVDTLMSLLISTLRKELDTLMEKEIKINTIGELDQLPDNVKKELEEVLSMSKDYHKGTLTIALSYGSQQEIIRACKNIAKKVQDKNLDWSQIDRNLFADALYTHDLPDVDLLIRTSGETRISNFLLWQIAYAELYFTDVLWPDFSKEDVYMAIQYFQSKERRFGKTSEQITTT